MVTTSYSQVDNVDALILVEGDSIPYKSIDLEGITIFPKLEFNNYEDKLRYYTIKRKTLKVYPYAIVASERLSKLNERLKLINTRAGKKKYTRLVEKYIEKELSAQLKKLTRTEGQILIKLVFRETGETVYDLVKKLRNSLRAFSYNSLAKLFDISIKTGYDPVQDDEDAIIEDVLKRAYGNKTIQLELNQTKK
tara:strand:+ start:577 stop:1158 length:582 start_codon:yes stop_codon:yes gene_type:complete